MSVRVCSGFSPSGYAEYGKEFLSTFAAHWPSTYELVVFTEHEVATRRGEIRSVWAIPGAREFNERHAANLEAQGRAPTERWKPSERKAGYCYRYDAVKFFKQLMIPQAASADMADGEILVWLDADVVTFADVPEDFIDEVIGDADLCYLGRGEKRSEIGFWAVRLNPSTRSFLSAMADMFRSDDVFKLRQWHSAYVFDTCLEALSRRSQVKDLTPGGKGHVWFQSPLCLYTDHLKGKRKAMGRSPERRF